MLEFLQQYGQTLLQKIAGHAMISLSALTLAILLAVPLGIIVSRKRILAQVLIAIASVFQTIPSLALLAMIVPILGVGRFPAIVALWIYALLPILRNTVLGINGVRPELVDAAKGMGMTSVQQIFRVQLPLALPVIMAGIRLSAVYVIAWTTLAAYIGAGGLGDFIFNGLNNFNFAMVIAGTVPITLMALLVDGCLRLIQRQLIPAAREAH